MTQLLLKKVLRDWVRDKEANGVVQHSAQWHKDKVFTIGGSSIATIQGFNPYSSIYKLIGEKVGLFKFISDIKPQWGNLFEDVIKRVVEYDKNCEVLGEDLFVVGDDENTSYSPDGLAVMAVEDNQMVEEETFVESPTGLQKRIEMVPVNTVRDEIVLVEFKCPQTRIPNGSPPKNYASQVKMGLDLLKLPSVGMLIEGVFRRCTWDQLGNNPAYDRTLVPRSSGKLPIAYGVIGFYYSEEDFQRLLSIDDGNITPGELIRARESLFASYQNHYVEYGDGSNDYLVNDIGDSPVELFVELMHAYDKGIISPWYGQIVFAKQPSVGVAARVDDMDKIDEDIDAFGNFTRSRGCINLGVLPWKLFRLDYHVIRKDDGYLKPWLPKIAEVIKVVRECLDPANVNQKYNILTSYIKDSTGEGFSDQ